MHVPHNRRRDKAQAAVAVFPNKRPKPSIVAAKLAEIMLSGTDRVRGQRRRRYSYSWQRDQDGIKARPPQVYRRLREVEAILEDNYGGKQLPNDDAGRADLFIVAQHIYGLGGDVVRHVKDFAAMWASWLSPAEARTLIEEVIARPRKWKADSLAKEMGVTKEQRDRLLGGLTTIGAIDCTAKQRKRLRRKRRAGDCAARRLADGAKPHAESAEQTKPWEAAGMSRRTWYRHRKMALGTDSRPAGDLSAGHETVPSRSEPSRKAGLHVEGILEGHVQGRPFQVEASRSW